MRTLSLFCDNYHFGNFKSMFNNKIPDTDTIIKPMSKANVLFISNYAYLQFLSY